MKLTPERFAIRRFLPLRQSFLQSIPNIFLEDLPVHGAPTIGKFQQHLKLKVFPSSQIHKSTANSIKVRNKSST